MTPLPICGNIVAMLLFLAIFGVVRPVRLAFYPSLLPMAPLLMIPAHI